MAGHSRTNSNLMLEQELLRFKEFTKKKLDKWDQFIKGKTGLLKNKEDKAHTRRNDADKNDDKIFRNVLEVEEEGLPYNGPPTYKSQLTSITWSRMDTTF